MSESILACNYKEWATKGLKDYSDFAECVEFVNQSEYGDDQLEGEWYYCDDERMVIYSGSFGNYNSPGADHYTHADVYDDKEEYEDAKAAWEGMPEYLEDEEEAEDPEE